MSVIQAVWEIIQTLVVGLVVIFGVSLVLAVFAGIMMATFGWLKEGRGDDGE